MLSWWAALLGGCLGNRECLVFGASGVSQRQRGGKLWLADSWWRPLTGRTIAGAVFCCVARKSALEQRRHGAGASRKTGSGWARVSGTSTQTSLLLLSLQVFPVAGGQTAASLWPRRRRGGGGRWGSSSSPWGTGAISRMRGNLGVGFQDWKIILRAPVSRGGLFGGRGSLTRDHRLEEDHLRLLDHRLNHLDCGAKAPGLQSRRIVSRLQRQQSLNWEL